MFIKTKQFFSLHVLFSVSSLWSLIVCQKGRAPLPVLYFSTLKPRVFKIISSSLFKQNSSHHLAAILSVLPRTLKSIELETRNLSFLNGISLSLCYSHRGCFCHIFRHSVPFTVHNAVFWFQKSGKQLHLLNCVLNTESLLVAGLRNLVRLLGITYWPVDHFLLPFPFNYTYWKMVMMRYIVNLPQGYLQRIQIFSSFCFTHTFGSNPILSNSDFSCTTRYLEWTAANFKSLKLCGTAF